MLVTDDGSRWTGRQLTPAVDLVSVTATSAREAPVIALDGRRFSTTDGGGLR